MKPSINFQHVLSELSVNRADPCEVVRELISNSYDAGATSIRYAPLADKEGFVFFDNGEGLSRSAPSNKISSYQAFFSIGESTKVKGEGIGYKCQGSKLCFACQRFLVLSRTQKDKSWIFKIVENPRDTLSQELDISPAESKKPWETLESFLGASGTQTRKVLAEFNEEFFVDNFVTGTLIVALGFDTENYKRHFLLNGSATESYLYNYIQFCTRHGDVRHLTSAQGFRPSAIRAIAHDARKCQMEVFADSGYQEIPFGFPYLAKDTDLADPDVKSPSEVSKLSDGRFYDRFAKKIHFGGNAYNLIFAIDGNRRAHEKYMALGRRGDPKSGIRLADQRGCFVASSGIKVCSFTADLFSSEILEDYQILGDADSVTHYLFVIEGQFDLVTNRNALSRASYKVLHDPEFLRQVKTFFDDSLRSAQSKVFTQLIRRLKREHSAEKRDQQLDQINAAKSAMGERERFRITIPGETGDHLFVSPDPGEENMVGALYASLGRWVGTHHACKHLWHNVITFSSYGIDSLAIKAGQNDLQKEHLVAVEYKYAFSNKGPFNHALVTVDLIVAWQVNFGDQHEIRDDYGCTGNIANVEAGVWEISDIEDEGACQYPHRVTIISLRELIVRTFPDTKFRQQRTGKF